MMVFAEWNGLNELFATIDRQVKIESVSRDRSSVHSAKLGETCVSFLTPVKVDLNANVHVFRLRCCLFFYEFVGLYLTANLNACADSANPGFTSLK